ncbi:MauE/DoxX family redox-associated membrane protein [Rossellomorea aquimaris]|uniref:MauE/DoxX family redox-associated membrane protein n=1 Tax=Rossellomorea aquimaris TaxID=189382 RepID=UPI0037C5628E
MSIISQGISLALGVLFVTAALDKMIHYRSHLHKVKAYKVLQNDGAIAAFSTVLILLELIVAVCFLFVWVNVIILTAAVSLQVIYMAFITYSLLKGNKRIDCGCGGVLGSTSLSWWLVGRNSVFIVAILSIEMFDDTRVAGASDRDVIFFSIIIFLFFTILQNMIRTESERY